MYKLIFDFIIFFFVLFFIIHLISFLFISIKIIKNINELIIYLNNFKLFELLNRHYQVEAQLR